MAATLFTADTNSQPLTRRVKIHAQAHKHLPTKRKRPLNLFSKILFLFCFLIRKTIYTDQWEWTIQLHNLHYRENWETWLTNTCKRPTYKNKTKRMRQQYITIATSCLKQTNAFLNKNQNCVQKFFLSEREINWCSINRHPFALVCWAHPLSTGLRYFPVHCCFCRLGCFHCPCL